MHTHKISAVKSRMLAMFAVILSVGLLIPSAHAHHSYAMYDGSVYRVFTGVIVRVIPNAAHFEFHFVPLNEKRDALVRDEKGEPLVWGRPDGERWGSTQTRYYTGKLPKRRGHQHGSPSTAGW